jgi:hypothetical protein
MPPVSGIPPTYHLAEPINVPAVSDTIAITENVRVVVTGKTAGVVTLRYVPQEPQPKRADTTR